VPHVLFIHEGQDWIRGSEQCLLYLVQHLKRIGWKASVAANSEVLLDEVRACGAVAISYDRGPDLGFLPGVASLSTARKVLKSASPDIVHFNALMPIKHFLPWLALMGLPSLAHIHITGDHGGRRYLWAPLVSRVVAVGEYAARGFTVDDRLAASRVTVIPNGVDFARLDKDDPISLRKYFSIPQSQKIILFVGSLIDRKRPADLIHAIAAVPDTTAVFVGDGDQRSALEALSSRLGISNRVHWFGQIRNVGPVLRGDADLVVAPSDWEALPLGIIEALGCGTRVIASDIPAHAELLAENDPNSLYAVGDVEALSAKIRQQVGRRFDATERSIAREIREQYSIEKYRESFVQLYTDVIASPLLKLLPHWTGVRAMRKRP
jgi:L-malate glycosyltransferase